MRAIDINSTVDMIRFVCDAIIESKDLLTDVDSRTGDGDHGMGMAGGMAKAKAALEAGAPFSDIASIFKTTGMAMLNSMGGASGVIFSSMFLGGVKGMGDIKELNGAAFCAAMADALTAIKRRGGAEVGDKTMVDALEPAVIAMDKADKEDMEAMLNAAVMAADKGVEDTKQYIAKFGRAQYIGERAIGFQDAGATSVAIIFRAMQDYIKSIAG